MCGKKFRKLKFAKVFPILLKPSSAPFSKFQGEKKSLTSSMVILQLNRGQAFFELTIMFSKIHLKLYANQGM